METNELDPMLAEKVKACKTMEELKTLAEGEGIEISDEQLMDIAGGINFCPSYTVSGIQDCLIP